MRFNQPEYLYLLLFVPVLIIFLVIVARNKKRDLTEFAELKFIPLLIEPSVFKRAQIKVWLIIITFFLLVITLAGPQIGSRMVQVKRHGVDIIIAVDCSNSMLAEDVQPNRMTRAKQELAAFIEQMQGDRVGIIAFSGAAFMQCPLTLDYSAAKMFLNLIDTNLIPRPGTAIGDAIRLAIKSFSQKERKYKVLLILTDGEDHQSDPLGAADEAKREGIRIYTIGFGNPAGEVIPIRDEQGNLVEYKKNRKGETVMSKLDEMLLEKISLSTGGKYYASSQGEIEVKRIYDDISGMEKKELQSRIYSQYEDRFQYFLVLVIGLLVVEFILNETKVK